MDWTMLFQTYGIATPILVFVGFCLVNIARWLGPRIDKLTDKWALFLERQIDESGRLTRLEDRVGTIWDFHVRRAVAEAVAKGVGTVNSPLVVTDEAKAWFADMRDGLRRLYADNLTLPFAELLLEIEKHFGNDILTRVCIPHGLDQGACLIIAAEVASDGAARTAVPKDPAAPGEKNV